MPRNWRASASDELLNIDETMQAIVKTLFEIEAASACASTSNEKIPTEGANPCLAQDRDPQCRRDRKKRATFASAESTNSLPGPVNCGLWSRIPSINSQDAAFLQGTTSHLSKQEPTQDGSSASAMPSNRSPVVVPVHTNVVGATHTSEDQVKVDSSPTRGRTDSAVQVDNNNSSVWIDPRDLRIRSLEHSYLFDVKALGGVIMFDTEVDGQSLRKTLEPKRHIQLRWDVRCDHDALFFHYGIVLGRVIDVQFMELACGNSPTVDTVMSLRNAVGCDGDQWMTPYEKQDWLYNNDKAKVYFRESSYEVFNRRPLPDMALEYSAGDVDVVEKLFDVYKPKQSKKGWILMREETNNRLINSMAPEKTPGSNKAPVSFAKLPVDYTRPSYMAPL
ncbi:uncharacterized protein PAC_06047 [Phialocephala subalpina]|uniref:3'-5' exonuclease domain-containing protein n=1 Tax=Phialocephala subalpina TaxID=576137 RepID=A0A1L7WTT3_9HELO|nr:uncharacterized protein PAC_06047 [Phialocephala subalpina]